MPIWLYMHVMNSRTPFLFLLATLASSPGWAQEPLSLGEAISRARTRNPELKALRARADAMLARGEATRKQALPRAGVLLTAERTDNAAAAFAHKLNAGEFTAGDFEVARLNAPHALSHLGTSFFVEVPVDIAGRFGIAAEGQAAAHRASTQSIREVELSLEQRVAEAYLSAVLAGHRMDAIQRAILAAQSRETVTQQRFNEGLALQADLLRVRARRRAREADLAAQRAELSTARALLARLMGSADGADFELIDPLEPLSPPDSLQTWKERATADRPALRATLEQVAAAGLAVRLEQRSSWPELAAQARLMDDRTSFSGGGRSWVGASLRWNVFDAARDRGVAAALADERASAEDARAARDLVRFQVESAFGSVVAARERLAAAQGGAVEAREALRVVQERRTQGLATLTDELETEAAAYAAELEEMGAAHGAALAERALRRAAGQVFGSAIQ